MASQTIVVVGLGEVGRPLMEIVSRHHHTFGVDLDSPPLHVTPVDVMHICVPFQVPDFIGESLRYIKLFDPALTIINSTVAVGTTRQVASCSGSVVVNSPVRGKHVRMVEDMAAYDKFIGALTPAEAALAAHHFESVGLKPRILSSPETTELAKLTETTYFGLMIAWAQEVERYCDLTGAPYDEVISFYEEINYLPPVKYFPGIIGGHCVMPNIEILRKLLRSDLVEAIRTSNNIKSAREKQLNLQTATLNPVRAATA